MKTGQSTTQYRFLTLSAGQGICLALCLVLLGASCTMLKANPEGDKWITLFNGKNLDGWTPKIKGYALGENFGNTFRVEDGVIKVAYDQYEKFDGKFGHLFYKEAFSHYRLRLDYRFTGEQTPGGPGWAFRNSGVMLHCQDPKTMGKDQNFPVCIEAQLLGGNGKNERSTGNMCSPGTHIVMKDQLVTNHCVSSNSKTFHGDQWVTFEVEVRGNGVIKHIINGELVMEYEQPQLDEKDADAKKLIKNGDKMLRSGYFSLQAESHACEFRNIKILPLED
jgi:hypothetical protein